MLKLNRNNYWRLLLLIYLNTSHVKVKLVMLKLAVTSIQNLNTSHVKVKHSRANLEQMLEKFKYISC